MAVKSYNGKEVTIIIGAHKVEGYGDGDFLSISRNNDGWTYGNGADGEGYRAKSNDNSGTFVITLLQTSLSNDILSTLASTDELTGTGVFPVLVKDLSGRTVYQAQTAWVMKYADVTFAREKSEREWTIATDNLEVVNIGGNN